MNDPDFDVIVVGSGFAGLIAALTAHEFGASVLVVEAEAVAGGASRLSAGMMMAAESTVQADAGIEDDKDSLYLEYMLANRWQIKPAIARRLSDRSGPTIDWLVDLGVEFFPFVLEGGGERVPRTHVPNGGRERTGGQYIIDVLVSACNRRGIDIALGNRVDHLLQKDGVVVGVQAGGEDLTANSVVLATGGFGANSALVKEHLPSIGRYGDHVFYIGPESSRGDGLELGSQVGAARVGHDVCKPSLTPRTGTSECDAYVPAWLLLLDPDARRLCDETAPYGQTFGLAQDAGGVVFGIFDAQTLSDNNTPALQTFKTEFPPGSPLPPRVWTSDGIARMLESGAIVSAETLVELADKLGLPAEPMAGAVERYNSFAADGEDRDHGKQARFLRPIATAPFYGAPIEPSAIGITAYGVEIDGDGHVLTDSSREIEGLFAAGECTGGVIGSRYVGSGNGLASAVVFGRIAGESAGRRAQNTVSSH